jgi:hypothetical protein
MQFGQAGWGIQGQGAALPSYPAGPHVGHLKLAAQGQFTGPLPLDTKLKILPICFYEVI